MLKPVLPALAASVERFLAIAPLEWRDAARALSSQQPINTYQHLMTRVDPKQVEGADRREPGIPPGRAGGGRQCPGRDGFRDRHLEHAAGGQDREGQSTHHDGRPRGRRRR